MTGNTLGLTSLAAPASIKEFVNNTLLLATFVNFGGGNLTLFDGNVMLGLLNLSLYNERDSRIPNVTSFANNQLPALKELTIQNRDGQLQFTGNTLTSLRKLVVSADTGLVFQGNWLPVLSDLTIEGK